MGAITNIPIAQPLRFINMNEQSESNTPTYDNRFHCEQDVYGIKPVSYTQLMDSGTDKVIFHSADTNVTAKYIKISTGASSNISLSQHNTGSEIINTGSFSPPSAGAGDYYYVILESTTTTDKYISETFLSRDLLNVENKNKYVTIKWKGIDLAYDDGIYWPDITTTTLRLVIEGRLKTQGIGQNKTVYNNAEYVPINLETKPLRMQLLEIEAVPFYMVEKVNHALNHDEFYVNGVQFNATELLEIKELGKSGLYSGRINLTQINY